MHEMENVTYLKVTESNFHSVNVRTTLASESAFCGFRKPHPEMPLQTESPSAASAHPFNLSAL
jgi:hypothetical protein